mgnify:CR=1 FL=1|tara:strand:- start:1293 stop:1859 length:567 start_codon:yes stop_codon:yes gene_type:complete
MFETLNRITQLEIWGATILRQGARASPEDLLEVLSLRALVDRDVPVFLAEEQAAPFFAMIRADRACAPFCATLLYLSSEDVKAHLPEGTSLNPMSWFGVHLWEVTEQLQGWVGQLQGEGVTAHVAEILQALLSLWDTEDRDWSNIAFVSDGGDYRETLAEEPLRRLCTRLQESRAAGETPAPEVGAEA